MGEERREYPVVTRMQGLWPENIGGFEEHRLREGGDVGHVDAERSVHNQRLPGEANWAQLAHQTIRRMKLENHAKELAQLEKRRRTKELQRRLVEGPKDPWRATRHGPMREVILTTHADWFKVTEGDPRFIGVLFKGLLANATTANARKIAAHAFCPPDLARTCQPDA